MSCSNPTNLRAGHLVVKEIGALDNWQVPLAWGLAMLRWPLYQIRGHMFPVKFFVFSISLSFMLCLQAFCSSKTLVKEPYFVIIFVVFKSFLGKINECIMDNCAENMWMKLSRSFCPAGNHPSWRRSCRVAIHARQHHRLFHDPTLALRQSFHQTLQRVLRF